MIPGDDIEMSKQRFTKHEARLHSRITSFSCLPLIFSCPPKPSTPPLWEPLSSIGPCVLSFFFSSSPRISFLLPHVFFLVSSFFHASICKTGCRCTWHHKKYLSWWCTEGKGVHGYFSINGEAPSWTGNKALCILFRLWLVTLFFINLSNVL